MGVMEINGTADLSAQSHNSLDILWKIRTRARQSLSALCASGKSYPRIRLWQALRVYETLGLPEEPLAGDELQLDPWSDCDLWGDGDGVRNVSVSATDTGVVTICVCVVLPIGLVGCLATDAAVWLVGFGVDFRLCPMGSGLPSGGWGEHSIWIDSWGSGRSRMVAAPSGLSPGRGCSDMGASSTSLTSSCINKSLSDSLPSSGCMLSIESSFIPFSNPLLSWK